MLIGDVINRSIQLSRRKLLGIFGVGTGWGLLSVRRGEAGGAAMFRAVSPPTKKLIFPKGAIVRTILKDLPPEELGSGITLFHDHVGSGSVDDRVIDELIAARKEGVHCIVNPRSSLPQNLENLKAISTRSNVHIVACAGYYMQGLYPPEVATKTEDQIAEDLAQEAHRDGLGAFGEIGSSPNSTALTPEELKVFRAVGKAHVRTNLPIFTHSPYGSGPNVPREAGLRQLDVFESVGVKPQHVVVGHACCLDDPKADIIKQIAKRGAFVGFDRMEAHHSPPLPGSPESIRGVVYDLSDEQRVTEVLEFLDAGYVDQLLLADDSTTEPLNVSGEITQMVKDQQLTKGDGEKIKTILYNAMGLGRCVTVFVPKLRKAGVTEATLHTILYDNARRFLAFNPKDS